MGRKRKIAGNLLLAGSLSFTTLAGLSLTSNTVHAEDVIKQVNFEDVANDFIQNVKVEKWDEVHNLLSDNLKKYVTKPLLSQWWSNLSKTYGAISNIKLKDVKSDAVHTKVTYICTTSTGEYELVLRFTKYGLVDDFTFNLGVPGVKHITPAYDLKNYTEKDVVIGKGEFSLPGKLTIPKGEGPFPVLVLVHGSGPHDMDGTFYSHKPFRDLAVGLANEGIAVLRYDKRTATHNAKFAFDTTNDGTIQEETVIDANLAVELLKSTPEIDPKNIFVFGHSQGAYALPLILQGDKEKDIKGVIGAAGPAGKFQDIMQWQLEWQLEQLKNQKAPAEQIAALQAFVTDFNQQMTLLYDTKYSLENPPKDFHTAPGWSWWYNLRNYIPADAAKDLNVPMLLIQGAKDLQVPITEFEKWQKTLQGKENVQYKLYPNMFHTLSEYKGEVDFRTEYLTPGTISEGVIKDLSSWVKDGKITEEPTVDPASYIDYKTGEFWSEAFAWALNKGIIVGYADEKRIKPEQNLLESQALKVLFRYKLGAPLKDESNEAIYTLAKEAGLVTKQKPNAVVTRGQAAIMLGKIFVKSDITLQEAVQWLYEQDVVQGYGNDKSLESFKPDTPISRAQLMTILYNLAQKN